MSDESLRTLERAATAAPDDLGASERLERAQARAGAPVESPGRRLVLGQLLGALSRCVARATINPFAPGEMFPRGSHLPCQLFPCPRPGVGKATIDLRYDYDDPQPSSVRYSPFTRELHFEPYGSLREQRSYLTCPECWARFQRTRIYPDPTRPGESHPQRWDGAWVLRGTVEWMYDPLRDRPLRYASPRMVIHAPPEEPPG